MIGLNIKLLRKRSKKSQEEVSNDLGLTRSSYSGYENGVAEPSILTLVAICDYFQVNVDMIARRDFSKFNEGDWNLVRKDTTTDVDGKHIRILTTTVDNSDNELIEMVPMKASAGYTSGYADEAYIKVLPTFSLPFLSKNKKYRSFPIQGDSMPPVSEGSHVVGEFVQNWSLIKNGTPCILVTKEDGIVFKVIYNHISSNQSLQLCSTNPFYTPYFIHVNEVIEIWKFVNYIASDLPEVKLDELQLKKSILDLQREVYDLKNSLTKQN
jgi:transcriptional regulator with XRE-family HTH domain